MGVAVTKQQDENQEGRGMRVEGGRTSEHLRQPTRVSAADAFPNAKRRRGPEVTNRTVPRQDHKIETERYFAKGLESSAPTLSEEDRVPTMQKPKRGAKEMRGKGEN